jgi:hypothetical protein
MAAPLLQLDVDTATLVTSIYHTAGWNFKTIWSVSSTSGLPTLTGVP